MGVVREQDMHRAHQDTPLHCLPAMPACLLLMTCTAQEAKYLHIAEAASGQSELPHSLISSNP